MQNFRSLLKTVWLISILSLMFNQLNAQQYDKCATMEADSMLRAKVPGAPTLADFEQWMQVKTAEFKRNSANKRRQIITIPIIVHVIHNGNAVGSGENISDAQVLSQIDVLNEDFRRLNADTVNTPAAFRSVAADIEIEFCPALRDPQGNPLPVPGINRVNTSNTTWGNGVSTWGNTGTIDNTVKPNTIWDPDQYFNMWSIDFGNNGLLGYAQFPEGSGLAGMPTGAEPANSDGVVVTYDGFGRVGNLNPSYDLGRTMTHEVGHWLGLRHIWGDGGCGADDFCADTPESDASNRGCNPSHQSCGTTDMVQNYMDYTQDFCMNIFTQDQKTRMLTVMANSPRRVSLLNSTVCTPLNPVVVTGQVRDINTLNGIAGAKVRFTGIGTNLDFNITCDANGNFVDTLFQGDFDVYGGAWGYITEELPSQSLSGSSVGPIIIDVAPGYYDDFALDFDWSENGNASTGSWVRGRPIGTTFNGAACAPGSDVATDFRGEAYVTGNGGGQAGTDDIDGGNTVLTSPVFDLSSYNEPYISYYRWFYNDGGSGTPDDNLTVRISNGNITVQVEQLTVNTANSNAWNFNNIRVRDFLTPTANMTFILESSDGVTSSTGHLVEAGLDVFSVVDSAVNVNVPPTTRFSALNDTICGGETVDFIDNSLNQPTGWSWSFPGGTPSSSTQQNPTVTYNAAGTYDVTLITTNAFGSDTLVKNDFITVTGVVPDFTADVTSGCAGLIVQFQDASTCGATNWNWSFPGGIPATSTQQNPLVTYSAPGTYDVSLTSGGNTITLPAYITVNNSGAVTVLSEDFESGSFATNGWSTDNPDGGITWDLFTVGGNAPGTVSAGIQLYNYTTIGQRDRLTTPVLDLSNVANTSLDFVHAYRRDAGTGADSLIIYVSTDGGSTYPNRVFGAAENGTGTYATNTTIGAPFTPSSADDWCFSGGVGATCFTVDLSAFDGEPDVRIRFESYNASENNMYIDDVVVSGECTAPTLDPIASFTGTPTSGCGTVTVTFNDQSLNGPTAWQWSFPGGSPASSTQQNPQVTYSATGNYTVTLIASNAVGADTLTLNNYIEVLDVPAVSLSVTNVSCNGGSNGVVSSSASGGTPPYTYQWSNNRNTVAINGLPVGTYSVTVTDANGCTTAASTTISQPTALSLATSSTPSVCGNSNGTATVTPSGGAGGYLYQWSGGANTATISGLTSGTYLVTVTDANGCSVNTSVNVAATNNSISLTINATDVGCPGGTDGSLEVIPTGGDAPYSYNWAGGNATAINGNLGAGTYNVTVTDANGCSTTGAGTITQPASLLVTETVTDATCGNANGAISLNVSGAAPPYSFAWTPTATGASINNLTSGSYTVTITDDNGCTYTNSYAVSNTGGPTVAISSTAASCNAGSDGTATINISGGAAPYNVLWSNAATSNTISGLSAGSYSVTVTDALGCVSIKTTTISQPAAITITVNTSGTTCNASNGSASATANGGTGNVMLSWPGNVSGNSVTGLAGGNYTVTATDDNGCTATQPFTINNISGPVLSISSQAVSCQGGANGSASVSVSGGTQPISYLWSTGDTTFSANNLIAGSYTVTVTDATGCTVQATTSVADGGTIVLTTTNTDASCGQADGSITTSVSGGAPPYDYLWGNGLVTPNLINIGSGTYPLTITDNVGCTLDTLITLVNIGGPVATISAVDVSCFGDNDGSVTANLVSGTPPVTYLWNNSSTASALSNLIAGTYTVTITDGNGCKTILTETVDSPDSLNINVSVSNATCNTNNGGAAASVLGGTPPYLYNWGSGFGSASSISNRAPGNYTLTVTDAEYCQRVVSFAISSSGASSFSLSSTDVSCGGANDGASAVTPLSGSAPYTYVWSNNSGDSAVTGLSGGVYVVTVTDGDGCVYVLFDTIAEPQALSLQFSVNDLACGGGQGSIKAQVQGGTAPYTYSWTDNSTAGTLVSSTAGAYGVTVTDVNGCSVSGTETIVLGNGLVVDVITTPDATNSGTGTATAVPLNGVPPYTYIWNDPANQTATQAVGLSAGTYYVTVTDGAGCSTVDSAIVAGPVGVNEFEPGAVNVYPNPTTGQFTVELNNITALTSVMVYDALGKRLMVEEIDPLVNSKYSMDISMYPEGMYFVKIISGSKTMNTRLVYTGL